MSGRRVLMASTNYWLSPFRVGSHHIARVLSEHGCEVAYVSEPISPFHLLNGMSLELKQRLANYQQGGQYFLNERLWAYVPFALFTPHNKPFIRSRLVYRNWHRMTFPSITDLIFTKGFGMVDLFFIDSIVQAFWLDVVRAKRSVFRLADRSSGFRKYTPAMADLERRLAQSVDLVVYPARSLSSYVEKLGPKRMAHLPNGVDFEYFHRGSRSLPHEYNHIPKPIAVYIGAMDVWFDYDLLSFAARKLSHVSFVLIGPDRLAKRRLPSLDNIYLLGRCDYADLPPYLHNADLGIIPFDVAGHGSLVNQVHPLKLYEYMACGLPVVAVEWEELRHINSPALIARGREEFVERIAEVLGDPPPREANIDFARFHDWNRCVERLAQLLEMGEL